MGLCLSLEGVAVQLLLLLELAQEAGGVGEGGKHEDQEDQESHLNYKSGRIGLPLCENRPIRILQKDPGFWKQKLLNPELFGKVFQRILLQIQAPGGGDSLFSLPDHTVHNGLWNHTFW